MAHEPRWGDRLCVFGVSVNGVIAGKLPENLLGYYDHATGTIHVDESLDRLRRHQTVVHERFHKALKHAPTATPGVRVARELLVEGMAAQYLISFRNLLDAFAACSDAQGMAMFLNVDCELIYARMMQLTPMEQLFLQVCGIRCIGIDLSVPHPDGVLVA